MSLKPPNKQELEEAARVLLLLLMLVHVLELYLQNLDCHCLQFEVELSTIVYNRIAKIIRI